MVAGVVDDLAGDLAIDAMELQRVRDVIDGGGRGGNGQPQSQQCPDPAQAGHRLSLSPGIRRYKARAAHWFFGWRLCRT